MWSLPDDDGDDEDDVDEELVVIVCTLRLFFELRSQDSSATFWLNLVCALARARAQQIVIHWKICVYRYRYHWRFFPLHLFFFFFLIFCRFVIIFFSFCCFVAVIVLLTFSHIHNRAMCDGVWLVLLQMCVYWFFRWLHLHAQMSR